MPYADPREALEGAKDRINRFADEGKITDDDAARTTEIVEAYDGEDTLRSSPEGESARSPTTLTLWISHMTKVAREAPLDGLHADPNGERETNVNAVIDRFHKGDSDLVKDDGIAKKTVQKIQLTMRRFYHYHDNLGVEADSINYYTDVSDDDTVDPRDMLTRDEILGARTAADHPRDEAMFTMLLYTGMRNAALRSLRWRDIDLERSRYKLNPNCEALKGADNVGEWRALLDAAQPLRDWKNYHPDPNNPDAYVFTKKPRWTAEDDLESETQLSSGSVSYSMRQVKKKAEIEKPMHPHMLRHNFVTIAKEDYELPDSTVKFLIGHEQDSDVMQRVYSHLSDESHNEKAEVAAGIREPDSEGGNRLSPETCRTCGNALPEGAKACSRCGTVFTPDAQAAEETRESAINDLADPSVTEDQRQAVRAIIDVIDDPVALADRLTEVEAK